MTADSRLGIPSLSRVAAQRFQSLDSLAAHFYDCLMPNTLDDIAQGALILPLEQRLAPPHIHVQRDDCAAKLWLDPLEFAFVEVSAATKRTMFFASQNSTATNSSGRGRRPLET